MKRVGGLIVLVAGIGFGLFQLAGKAGDGLVEIEAGPTVPLHDRIDAARAAFHRDLFTVDQAVSDEEAALLEAAIMLMDRKTVPLDQISKLHAPARRAARAAESNMPPASVLLAADMIISRNNGGVEERSKLLDRVGVQAEAEQAHLIAMYGDARRAYMLRREPEFLSLLAEFVPHFVGASAATDLSSLQARVWYKAARDLSQMEGAIGVAQVFDEHFKASPDADRWLQHMFSGIAAMKRGWAARGNDTSDKITREGGGIFWRELKSASDHMIAAWEIAPDRPESAVNMISITMSYPLSDERTEEIYRWFKRAVAAELDLSLAYDAMLLALEPKWGGSLKDMYDFGVSCEETNRYDTNIPWVLIQAVIKVSQQMQSWEILDDDDVYERVMRVLDKYRTRPDGGGQARGGILSMQTAFAWYRGDFEKSREAWRAAGGRVDEQYLGQVGTSLAEVGRRFGDG